MSDLAQVEENCRIFQESVPLSEVEEGVLMDVAESLKGGVPCTQAAIALIPARKRSTSL